jgi:hypothetical protein
LLWTGLRIGCVVMWVVVEASLNTPFYHRSAFGASAHMVSTSGQP